MTVTPAANLDDTLSIMLLGTAPLLSNISQLYCIHSAIPFSVDITSFDPFKFTTQQ